MSLSFPIEVGILDIIAHTEYSFLRLECHCSFLSAVLYITSMNGDGIWQTDLTLSRRRL